MTKLFWSKKWGKDKLCGITLSRLRPGKNKLGYKHSIYLSCNHGFYRKPLIKWIIECDIKNPTCPTCRKIFNPIICFT